MAKKMKAPAPSHPSRDGTMAVSFDAPTDLYLAVKSEARAQGLAVSGVLITLMREWLMKAPAWKLYIAQRAMPEKTSPSVGRLPGSPARRSA